MQKVKLPKQVDPVKSATKRSDYRGIVATSEMPRLLEVVVDIADQIDVEIKFSKDEQGLTYFQGHMACLASLRCERCNQAYEHQIDVSFCFSPVQSSEPEESDELPEVYEPVEVDDHGEINLFQVLEDELILSLPIVALHAEEDCGQKRDKMSFGKIEPADERPNPFAVLKELKRD
ncbi:23S rRNA accumulation protein YceD [Paraglaciecola aquimarina]|uniref:Large ribosomal RNA subunit accumulation protein YceD n=1 Tax=Paraglaciecola aquimarina TaxID=1235557 RepID=A0ABU3SZ77_9ALTE|nr:23S rRNA accumulation protein YceD [Paraglaciecola aquimarina]MDU0355314.1 23S rRNA accumulation protein YceD [Paraglaciecola aquimarina]